MAMNTQRPRRAKLESLVRVAAAKADQIGQPQFVSCSANLEGGDPLALFERASGSEHRFYWSQPARESALASWGTEALIETTGPGRFAEAWRAVADIGAAIHLGPSVAEPAGPLFVGGFAFADQPQAGGVWHAFPTTRLVLPRVLLRQQAENRVLWVTQRVAP
ncbi:hypothetical protein MK280_14880, partial [Myxococcota bacterium]|nr:hypothetical protein [Myxococcota bacterium]